MSNPLWGVASPIYRPGGVGLSFLTLLWVVKICGGLVDLSPIQSRDICSLWNMCCHINHANQSALTPYAGERVLPWLDMTVCWVGAVGTDKTLEATHSSRSGLSLWAERARKIVLGTTLLYHPLKGGKCYRLHSGLESLEWVWMFIVLRRWKLWSHSSLFFTFLTWLSLSSISSQFRFAVF